MGAADVAGARADVFCGHMTEYTRQIFARIIAQSTQNRKDGHAQYQVAFEADIAHAGLTALEDFLDGAVVECDVGVGGFVCGFKKPCSLMRPVSLKRSG